MQESKWVLFDSTASSCREDQSYVAFHCDLVELARA